MPSTAAPASSYPHGQAPLAASDLPNDWPSDWPVCHLCTPQGDTATLSLHGGQVLSWRTADNPTQPAPQEHLYLSPRIDWQAVAQGRCAIRGGIPICWPQFNRRGPLPKHGLARLLPWALQEQTPSTATLRLRHTDVPPHLLHSPQGQPLWPHAFEATLHIHLAHQQLSVRLHVRNTGHTAMPFTAALHGYLATADLAQTTISGGEGLRYWDARANATPSHPTQQGPIRFADEVDRVYPAFASTLACGGARLHMQQSASFGQSVIWNPHAALCAQLPDLPPNAWRHFVCIEAAQIDTPVLLPPGAQWQGWQTFRAHGLSMPASKDA